MTDPTGKQVGRKEVKLPALQQVSVRTEKLIGDVVTLLAGVVSRLRTPLLVVALCPVVLALVLIVISVVRGGPDVPFAVVLGILGAVPGLWLAWRRHQLVTALQPPAVAAAEIYAAFAPAELWAHVKTNLRHIPVGSRIRPRALAGRMWKGVKLGNELRRRFADIPRLAPFLPGRLRGAALLGAWCLGSSVVLAGLSVIKVFTSLLGIG